MLVFRANTCNFKRITFFPNNGVFPSVFLFAVMLHTYFTLSSLLHIKHRMGWQ